MSKLSRSLLHNFPLVFDIIAALAEFEQELIRERPVAGLQTARGRKGGQKFGLTKAKVRPRPGRDEKPGHPGRGALPGTRWHHPRDAYRYVSPEGELREHGRRVLEPLSRVENAYNLKSSLHENDATLNPTLIYSSKKSMIT